MVDRFTRSHDGDIFTIEYLDSLTHLKQEVVVGINIRNGSTTDTDVAWLVIVDEELYQFLSDAPVGRQTNGHAREGA